MTDKYVLARRWMRNDPDLDVESVQQQPGSVVLPKAPGAPLTTALPGEPGGAPVFPDDSDDYNPEESVRRMKRHWVEYGEAAYWDERYAREPTCFDWYQNYAGLEPILKQHIPIDADILHVGVGTSVLQADMVMLGGYQHIISIDVSSVAIQQMRDLHNDVPQLKYQLGDARSMPDFKDASFQAVIDKGTLDAILCGEHASSNAANMLQECTRVLRPGAVLLIITYGDPAARLPLLLHPNFGLEVIVYILGKNPCAPVAQQTSLKPIIQGPFDSQSM
eukprot:gene2306-2614_t